MAGKNTTIKSIAEYVGVDSSTVSRVINGLAKEYRISTKTVKAVNEAVEKLNYKPNKIAKSLRLKKTFTIGLVVPDISNPWFADIISKIEKESRQKGYNVFLCNSDDSEEIEEELLLLLEDWKVDGIILTPIGLKHEHLLNLYKKGMPMVLVDRFFEKTEIPYVSTNDYLGALEATECLIKNGHKNIACIQGLIGTSQNTQRVEGYKEALSKNNIPINNNFIKGDDFGFENGYLQAKEIAKNLKETKITGIISTGNQITLGVLKALKEVSISVPEDISIVSFDEQDYLDLLYTPMTTVSHFNEDIGKNAVQLLFAQINKQSVQKSTLLPTKLIKRGSVCSL